MNKQTAREALRAAASALTPLGVCWWIDCGTLLGAIREGGFMEHDLDVDLSSSDWERSEEIEAAMTEAGFSLRSTHGTPAHGYEQKFRFRDVNLDIFYFYRDGGSAWQGSWLDDHLIVSRLPLIETTTPFDLQGIEIPIPTQAEALLEARYGDWRTPVTRWDWARDPKCITPATHPDVRMSDVSFLIKTFLRPDLAARAVRSVRQFHPESDVLVVDDGGSELDVDAEVLRLPYDSGLSAGRNAGIKRIKTQFVCLFDDDMYLTEETNVPAMLRLLSTADIVCGSMRQGRKVINWEGTYAFDKGLTLVPRNGDYERYGLTRFARVDFGLNALVARTEFLRKHPWDEQLKLHEHTDFFLGLRGKGKVVFTPDSIFQHEPEKPPEYDFMRRRMEFRLLFFAKHGFTHHTGINGYRDNWTWGDVEKLDALQGRRPPLPVSKLKRYETTVNGVQTVLRLNDADAKRLGLFQEPQTEPVKKAPANPARKPTAKKTTRRKKA